MQPKFRPFCNFDYCADCLCGRATRRAGSPVAGAAGPEPALPWAGAVSAALRQGSAPASGAPGRAPGGKNCTNLSVFWIRIQYFRLNSDPDPGFWWLKIEKINSLKNWYFLIKKIAVYLSQCFHKGRRSYRRSLPRSWSTDLIESGSNLDPDPKHWSDLISHK